ncbi:MAG: putative Mg2+ transporter-C (MgtC) family protein [Acidimicrobiaceae bacterium]
MWNDTERLMLEHIALAFALSFAIGFERGVRGTPAGDRTYALVGTGAAAVTAVTLIASPQAIAGVLTGIGFIGGGLVFRGEGGMLKGITSAATIFAVAAIGIVAGAGHSWMAIGVTAMVLVDLELRQIPILKHLDARRYNRDDDDMMK